MSAHNLTCGPDDVYNVSDYCLYEDGTDPVCRPDINSVLIDVAGYWCIVNAVIGFSGNLLTLLAIPYASRHKR